jgi:hypothetical protein
MDASTPLCKKEWGNAIFQLKEAISTNDTERLLQEAQLHHNLRSYWPAWWIQTGSPGVNRTLHNNKTNGDIAKKVGRILVGGQGLRCGDPTDEPEVSKETCCVPCLREGRKCTETLRHVALECETYLACRKPIINMIRDSPADIFTLCRKRWSWAQLRALTRFYTDIIFKRDRLMEGITNRADAIDEAERLWEE